MSETVIEQVRERGMHVHVYPTGMLLVNAWNAEDADWMAKLGFQTLPYKRFLWKKDERMAWECTATRAQFDQTPDERSAVT